VENKLAFRLLSHNDHTMACENGETGSMEGAHNVPKSRQVTQKKTLKLTWFIFTTGTGYQLVDYSYNMRVISKVS
jgi:hypothetical protein